MKTLKVLFLDESADLNCAGPAPDGAQAKLAEKATPDERRGAFASPAQTGGHIKKLNTVFLSFEESVRQEECEALVGRLQEGVEIAGSSLAAAALIQKVHTPARTGEPAALFLAQGRGETFENHSNWKSPMRNGIAHEPVYPAHCRI